jgi:hypothetical protein
MYFIIVLLYRSYGFVYDDTVSVFNGKWALENLSLAEKLLSGG